MHTTHTPFLKHQPCHDEASELESEEMLLKRQIRFRTRHDSSLGYHIYLQIYKH
jgi:hypothetical protein